MLNVGPPGGPGPAIDVAPCFAGLEHAPALLLAVSGGPDSMALLHLAALWRSRLVDGPALHVATVDHGLRAASRAEADLVEREAAARGLSHATLVWTGDKPVRGLQEKAREARYGLLLEKATELGAPFVLTAHHADDQAETVLMRLGRGSGVTGLAAMRRATVLGAGVTLVRPLLGLTKADLLRTCEAGTVPFASDASNDDPTYLRTRLRRHRAVLDALGLDRPGLVRLARRMARADEALERETDRLVDRLASAVAPARWTADLGPARGAADEIVLRVLGRAIRHVGGRDRVALEKLEAVADGLRTALEAGQPFRRTIAGTLVSLDPTGLLDVSHEPTRRRPSSPDRGCLG